MFGAVRTIVEDAKLEENSSCGVCKGVFLSESLRPKSTWTIVTVEITKKVCLELFGRPLGIQDSSRILIVMYVRVNFG